MSSTLGRAAMVVSGGILLSRVLGFVREIVLAALLGRTIEADLYVAAFAIPDFLFFLMAGGYLTITFVPIVTRHLAEGSTTQANRSFTAVAKIVGGLMLVVTVITMAAARPLTESVFPEIPAERIPELVSLVRIILPAQFFFVIGSLLMAVQYAHRRFLIPTLAPLIYNLAIICGGLVGWAMGDPSPAGFIWGALIGAIVGNFGLQWWGARRLGLRFVGGVPLRHSAVPEYFGLALPLMIGQSAVGLDEVFMRLFGQFGAEGDIAALGYARRLNMLPVGVIAQAAGVASYPFLARLFAEGNLGAMRDTVNRAVRTGLVVAGLAAAGVISLAVPITQVAYQRGEFGSPDTAAVAGLLAIYGISIPLWAAHQIYTRGFYAQRRMWLPVVVGTVITALAVPLYLFAATRWGGVGVAWVSVTVMAAYSVAMAAWWHRSAPLGGVAVTFFRTVAAGLPAGAAAWGIVQWSMEGAPTDIGPALISLVIGGSVAVAIYWAVLRIMRAPELGLLRRSDGSQP